jgi:hypothetical protein
MLSTGSSAVHSTSSSAELSTSSGPQGTGGSNTGGAGAGTQPPTPALPTAAAEYNKATGAPANKVAKKQLARVWKTGVATEGKKTRVVQVPVPVAG